MNKHILLVMKWLNDKDSVSQEELEKNKHESYAANTRADYEAYNAAFFADFGEGANAARWVNEYFEITGEDKNEYEKELNK